MQARVHRYLAKAGRQPEFEEMVGPGGLWAALFHEAPAYHGSILLRSHERSREYTLLDFWDSREAFEAFREAHAAACAALRHEAAQFWEREEPLGWFEDL